MIYLVVLTLVLTFIFCDRSIMRSSETKKKGRGKKEKKYLFRLYVDDQYKLSFIRISSLVHEARTRMKSSTFESLIYLKLNRNYWSLEDLIEAKVACYL